MGSSHTEKDSSTEYYSVVSMVKNTRYVLVRTSIETNTHLNPRQGSPIFLICLLLFFFVFCFSLNAGDITGLVDFSPHSITAEDKSDESQRYWRSAVRLSQGLDWISALYDFGVFAPGPLGVQFSTVCSRYMVAALGLS